MKKTGFFIYQTFLVFAFLGILLIPFSFQYLSIATTITPVLFEDLVLLLANSLKITVKNPEFSSDSTTLYLLIPILLGLSIIVLCLHFLIFKSKKVAFLITHLIPLLLYYYLATVLLKYGFDKLFKVQFYAPEPNILYTPFGQLDKDILLWSTLGTSYSYSLFMGLLEIIPALLLLYKKTRVLGLFILFGVLIHVVALNISFDISVKLYAIFLFFICCLLIVPHLRSLIAFFAYNQTAQLLTISGKEIVETKKTRLILKIIAITLIFIEIVYPFLASGNFNGDTTPKNYLHGAYEVVDIVSNDTRTTTNIPEIKRIFIHRNNYFILQYANDSFEDYYFEMNKKQKTLQISNYNNEISIVNFDYSEETKLLKLQLEKPNITIIAKALDWKKLPALQPLFHLTVDEIAY